MGHPIERTDQTSKGRRHPRRFLTGGALALLILLLGEVASRAVNAHRRAMVLERHGFESEEQLVSTSAPPPLFYVLKPDIPGITNRDGYCGPALPKRKAEGVFRVAVIGDSVSMHGPSDELYHELVRQRLVEEFPGRVEFLNFAVTGYNPEQEAARLRASALAYDPDLVLWQLHDNDGAHAVYDSANAGLARYYNRPVSALWDNLHWNLYRALRDFSLRDTDAADMSRDLWVMLYSFEDVCETLQSALGELEARHIDVLFLLYPSWPEGDDWSRYHARGHELHKELSERLVHAGARVLDLLPVFAELDPGEYRVAPEDPWHPNARGHAVIAEQLYPVLRSMVVSHLEVDADSARATR